MRMPLYWKCPRCWHLCCINTLLGLAILIWLPVTSLFLVFNWYGAAAYVLGIGELTHGHK